MNNVGCARYFDKVVPQQFGTPLRPWFLFLPSFWFPADSKKKVGLQKFIACVSAPCRRLNLAEKRLARARERLSARRRTQGSRRRTHMDDLDLEWTDMDDLEGMFQDLGGEGEGKGGGPAAAAASFGARPGDIALQSMSVAEGAAVGVEIVDGGELRAGRAATSKARSNAG